MREYRRPKPVGAVVVGGLVTVVSLLPVFLTGAMAVQMTRDLAFGSVGLGLAVAAFRGGGVVTSVFLGRLADQLGATRSIRLAAVLAAIVALGIATTARGLTSLLVWLLVGGSAIALAQPAANRLLMAIVNPRRLGLAFGAKQSAPPLATMLAGAAVPVVAVTLGWRWAFVMAAAAALVLVFAIKPPPRRDTPEARAGRKRREPLENRDVIVLLALSFGLGAATSSLTTTFYVASAAEAGSSPQFAGTMLAVASVASIAVRILAGIVSDRMQGGHLLLCAGIVTAGALGLSLLSTGNPTIMAIGVTIALGGSWGFQGVFWFALVRAYPDMPGRITGAVSPGTLSGSTFGPLIFGFVVERTTYSTSWLTGAAIALVAAVVMVIANRRLAAARPGPATTS